MEWPKRKNNRLSTFDYNSPGVYFLTICTKDRKCILSRIVGDDALGVPQNQLTIFGKIVEKYIISSNQMGGLKVDKYVIMPNHIHILLQVDMETDGPPRASASTMAAVPKFISVMKRLVNKEIGRNIFQRSYHDHIIRSRQDYLKIWEYMENNPKQWELDCFYMKES